MQINTKYNCGDEVFFMGGNKVQRKTIERIEVHSRVVGTPRAGTDTVTNIKYHIDGVGLMLESDLYASKEQLLKTL